jgi:hypothetical protein
MIKRDIRPFYVTLQHLHLPVQGHGTGVVPDAHGVSAGGELSVAPVVIDSLQRGGACNRVERLDRIRLGGAQRPLLYGLVVTAGEERLARRVGRHSAHEARMRKG